MWMGLCASLPVSAQEPTGRWLLDTTHLTGDWGGTRSGLEDRGIRFSLFYIHYFGHKDRGGFDPVRRRSQSGSADLFGQFDFDTMNAIRGGEALIQLKHNWGHNINPPTGALSDPIDDADGDHALYINQLWYQHSSPSRTWQVRLGYLDQQTILDRNAFANSEDRQFMSTFLDNNNAIIPLATGPGIALFYNATDWLSLVATASDANAQPRTFSFAKVFGSQYLTYFETDFHARLDSPNGPLPGNYRFGFFIDPRDHMRFGGERVEKQSEGFYLSFDQMLYGEPTGDDQGVGIFFRYGWRPAEVNRITRFWSGGAQYTGLFPHAEDHTLGFGAYTAIGSDVYRVHLDPSFDRETAYELYYAVPIGRAIRLTPGIQYIRHPGALTTRDNVFVFAFRARFNL